MARTFFEGTKQDNGPSTLRGSLAGDRLAVSGFSGETPPRHMQRQDRTVSQPAIARDLIELQCDSTASSKLLCPSLSQSVCLIGFNCCVQHWWRLLLASPLPAAALLPSALLLLAFMAT